MADTERQPVSLREVSSRTVRQILDLQVAPAQEQFVASNAVTIAQAYFDRESVWLRAIYAGETPVGFLALWDADGQYHLLRFMVDQRWQGMGYGRQAVHLLFDHLRGRPAAQRLTLYSKPGEGSPQAFYERLGFVATGEMDDDALVMEYLLPA